MLCCMLLVSGSVQALADDSTVPEYEKPHATVTALEAPTLMMGVSPSGTAGAGGCRQGLVAQFNGVQNTATMVISGRWLLNRRMDCDFEMDYLRLRGSLYRDGRIVTEVVDECGEMLYPDGTIYARASKTIHTTIALAAPAYITSFSLQSSKRHQDTSGWATRVATVSTMPPEPQRSAIIDPQSSACRV